MLNLTQRMQVAMNIVNFLLVYAIFYQDQEIFNFVKNHKVSNTDLENNFRYFLTLGTFGPDFLQ